MNILVEHIVKVNENWYVIGFDAANFEKVAVKSTEREAEVMLELFDKEDPFILELPFTFDF